MLVNAIRKHFLCREARSTITCLNLLGRTEGGDITSEITSDFVLYFFFTGLKVS